MKKNKALWISVVIILISFIIITYVAMDNILKSQVKASVESRIEEITSPNRASFEMLMNEQINSVKTLANYLAQSNDLRSEEHLLLLEVTAKTKGLARCVLAFPDGSYLSSDHKNDENLSNQVFFQEAMKGNFYISNPGTSVIDENQMVILFTSPIVKEGTVIGAIIYAFSCDNLDSVLNFDIFNVSGKMILTNSESDILYGAIAGSEEKNITRYVQSIATGVSQEKSFKSHLNSHGLLDITAKQKDQSIYIVFDKLGFKDWYGISIIPQNVALQSTLDITHTQQNISFIVIAIVLVGGMIALYLWYHKTNSTDKMTGALAFNQFKKTAVKFIENHPETRYIIVKLDIKDFKLINRIYGFDYGDAMIKNMAKALEMTLNYMEFAYCRVHVENFIFIIPYFSRKELDRLRIKFKNNFFSLMGDDFIDNIQFPTGEYITRKKDNVTPDMNEIYEKVNFAHHVAKQRGGEAIIDYEEAIEEDALHQKSLEDRMETALKKKEFKLFLQPKYALPEQKICGAEALVRWQMEDGTLLSPGEFLPLFEKNEFIVKLDFFIFEQAVIELRKTLSEQKVPFTISVNFSRRHLYQKDFVSKLCHIADKYRVPHHYLEVELTESIVFDNENLIVELLNQLHQNDFHLSMDDFGSGYSSLSLLKNLPVDVLKIDKGFFDDGEDDQRGSIVIANIIRMARELSIITVAEGIETKDKVDLLSRIGCNVIQGYYFAKPMAVEIYHQRYKDEFKQLK